MFCNYSGLSPNKLKDDVKLEFNLILFVEDLIPLNPIKRGRFEQQTETARTFLFLVLMMDALKIDQ